MKHVSVSVEAGGICNPYKAVACSLVTKQAILNPDIVQIAVSYPENCSVISAVLFSLYDANLNE